MQNDGKLSSNSNLGFAQPTSLRKPHAQALSADHFDADLLVPSTLHDARYSYSVVAVALVQLHLQGCLRVPGIDADDG